MDLNIPKILLVRPPELREASFAQFYTFHECLGLGYLAAYLRHYGYLVEIIDGHVQRYDIDEAIAEIKVREFDVLGISIDSSLVFPHAARIFQEIKAWKDTHITLGGYFPTFSYESILRKHPEVDSIVRFEGEQTLLELIAQIKRGEEWKSISGVAYRTPQGVFATPPRDLVSDLDVLPFPARDTLPRLLEIGGLPQISASRGCPGRCSFCSIFCFFRASKGKAWRARSPENIVEEIEILQKDYGCDELWFVDDNFLGPGKGGRKRIRDLLTLLDKREIKLSRIDYSCRPDSVVEDPGLIALTADRGAKMIYLGVEAGVQRILDLYNKGTTVEQNKKAIQIIKNSHAHLKVEFIFFNPWITFDEVKETLSFLEEMRIYDPYILTSILTVMKQAPLAKQIETGQLRIVAPPPELLEDFDLDSYIPYQITDERVRTLFRIVSLTFIQFEPALHAIDELCNLLRTKRKRVDPEFLAKYEEILEDDRRLLNEVTLDLFKEAMNAIESVSLPVNSSWVENTEDQFIHKALGFLDFMLKALRLQERELMKDLDARSV